MNQDSKKSVEINWALNGSVASDFEVDTLISDMDSDPDEGLTSE